MTSVLLAKAPDRMVAVADGRVSVTGVGKIFDKAEKIRRFKPKYFIPEISMGFFECFSEYVGTDWFLAYAGTYSLADQISDTFINRVTSLFLARREDGSPVFCNEFDRNGIFDDSYNFSRNERPKILTSDIITEFEQVFLSKCDEWAGNRQAHPDVEFLLFGEDEETGLYSAFRVCASEDWYLGAPTKLVVVEVKNGELGAIGSPAVAGIAYNDKELQAGLEGWKVGWWESNSAFEAEESVSSSSTADGWSLEDVRNRLIKIIREVNDDEVGDPVTVVSCDGVIAQLEAI